MIARIWCRDCLLLTPRPMNISSGNVFTHDGVLRLIWAAPDASMIRFGLLFPLLTP
jgi:hypothetical protein